MKFESNEYEQGGFFDYRQNIDFGSEALQSYYPYYYFLDWYLDNKSFEKYCAESKLDRKSFTHNRHKLKMIDSLISHDTLRNNMLYSLARRCLVNGSIRKKSLNYSVYFWSTTIIQISTKKLKS